MSRREADISFEEKRRSALLWSPRRIVGIVTATLIVWALAPLAAFSGAGSPSTQVTVSGTDFFVGGRVTYPGTSVEGLLLNSRMVQAVFDDENPETVGQWAYP
ncbi:MAG TPA: hypothetical protein VM470_08460, partial [Acidimicrobiia bacterium]|nr:hypothetical protein [Acidimicrobiia bacterium]